MDTQPHYEVREAVAGSNEKSPGPSWKVLLIGLVIVLALGALYVLAAEKMQWWPYGSQWEIVPTATWKTYTNTDYGFTIKHPNTWHSEECRDSGPGGTYLLVALGDAQDLVICNSDAPFEGIIGINAAPNSEVSQQEIDSTMENLDDAKQTNVTIDGVSATRIEGVTRQSEGPGPGAGKKLIMLLARRNNVQYRWFFLNDAVKADQFEQVLRTFKFGDKASGDIEKWETYRNTKYGFELDLPESWKGYALLSQQWEGRDVTTGAVLERGPLLVFRHPQWTPLRNRQDMPVMVLTPAQWQLVENQTMSLGAAPIPPSELGRNSKYIFALPARYNYSFGLGWEEVDKIVHNLRAIEPVSG